MKPALPGSFLQAPIAHRGLHDVAQRRPENSRVAIRAAVQAGYGIEIDLQLTADGHAVVFHDYDMFRLTGQTGPIRQQTLAQTARIPLLYGDGECIPELGEVLELVNGQAPLLIELKDQDGSMGLDIGALETATAQALAEYGGPVAVMSFNPNSISKLAQLAPTLPRGLVTDGFDPGEWPLSSDVCARLRKIPDFETSQAGFISHQVSDLRRPRVAELKADGVPVLCWTVRSPQEEAEARKIADNVTFEGYLAATGS